MLGDMSLVIVVMRLWWITCGYCNFPFYFCCEWSVTIQTRLDQNLIIKKNGTLCACIIKLPSIKYRDEVHSNLPKAKYVATKVHVILKRYVVLAWIH